MLAGLLLAVAAITLGAAPAAGDAPSYPVPDDGLTIVLGDTTVTVGEGVTITVTGCFLGEPVNISVGSVSITSTCEGTGGGTARSITTPGATGSTTVRITAPSTPGRYTVTATAGDQSATAILTVVAATGGATTGQLPGTGSDSNEALWIAGGTLAAGLGLTAVAWRRRRSRSCLIRVADPSRP